MLIGLFSLIRKKDSKKQKTGKRGRRTDKETVTCQKLADRCFRRQLIITVRTFFPKNTLIEFLRKLKIVTDAFDTMIYDLNRQGKPA